MKLYIERKIKWLKQHPNKTLRITIGVLLVIGGIFGILPILGFWMFPLGIILLSVDFPIIRKYWRMLKVITVKYYNYIKEKAKSLLH